MINTEKTEKSPTITKKVSIGVNIWKHLMRKGATLLRTWKETSKTQGDTFGQVYDKLMNVLRSKLVYIVIDPPLPVVEMVRNEFSVYQKTMLQEYLYELLFKEVEDGLSNDTSSTLKMPPLYTDEQLIPERFHMKELVDQVLNEV